MPNPANDVAILNTALAAELEAIAAYGVGAGSGLFKGARAEHWPRHSRDTTNNMRDVLGWNGGESSAARRSTAKRNYSFPVETLKTQNDVLRFAADPREGRVSAYLGAVPVVQDRELAKAAASILGDEAMHWAVLRQAVGEEPVPAAFCFVDPLKSLFASMGGRGIVPPCWAFITTGCSSPPRSSLVITPGQDTFFILGRSLSGGRSAGIAAALGITAGSVHRTPSRRRWACPRC